MSDKSLCNSTVHWHLPCLSCCSLHGRQLSQFFYVHHSDPEIHNNDPFYFPPKVGADDLGCKVGGKAPVVQLCKSNEIGCEVLSLCFNLKSCHAGSQWPCSGKGDLCSPRWQDSVPSAAGICHVAFVVCSESHIYGSAAQTVPVLNSADLYLAAQEAPKCAPRVRAVQANWELSPRKEGGKQGPNFSKGKHGRTPAVPHQNNMHLHQKGVPISCAGCF